jgi:hypothetical protein
MITNSQYNFILVDCCLVAFFLNLVKLPHYGHVDHGDCNFEINPTETGQRHLLELKLNSDITTRFYFVCSFIENGLSNAMVYKDDT